MVGISKPLFASTARRYFRDDKGVWHGVYAKALGLEGPVLAEHFDRLSEGQDPWTGEQYTRSRKAPAVPSPTWVTHDDAWRTHLQTLILEMDPEFFGESSPNRRLSPLALPEPPATEEATYTSRHMQLIEIHRIAAQYYSNYLNSAAGQKGRLYLEGRGVSPALSQEFGLGYAPPSGRELQWLLTQKGYSRELLVASGLFIPSKTTPGAIYAHFRDRVLFPITDSHSNVIAFGGRLLDDTGKDQRKYINSPTTDIYSKTVDLFNVARAKEHLDDSGRFVVVEGYLDVLAAHSAGIKNVIGACGTSLTPDHIKRIGEMVRGVILNYDSDPNRSGVEAARRAAALFIEQGISVHTATLDTSDPAAKADPAQYIQDRGAKAYRRIVERPDSLFQWLVKDAFHHYVLSELYGIVDAKHDLLDRLSRARSDLRVRISREMHRRLGLELEPRPQAAASMPRRAAWSITVSMPKSFTLAATVGGDRRIYDWHAEARNAVGDFLESKTQVHMGGNNPPETSGKWVAALYDHESARPVDGYSAPQIHSHFVVFNLSPDSTAKPRALQTKEWHNAQKCGTRIYQDIIAKRAREAGYEIEYGDNKAPEIAGFSPEYLVAESQRHEEIHANVADHHLPATAPTTGYAALATRSEKQDLTPSELLHSWEQHGAAFGDQAKRIVEAAAERAKTLKLPSLHSVEEAVSHAIRRLSERYNVLEADGYKRQGGILQNALEYGCEGDIREIRAEIERRTVLTEADRAAGHVLAELIPVTHYRTNAPGIRYTTREALQTERANIESVLKGRGACSPINHNMAIETFREHYQSRFDYHQPLHVLWNLLGSRDKIQGLEGLAGTGKTHLSQIIAEVARQNGYEVRGLAPTSGARKELQAVGIESMTLAKHNLQESLHTIIPGREKETPPRLYLLDEASLASSAAIHTFLQHLRSADRAILIGDTYQHQSIEAGRAFYQLREAGMHVEVLNKIVRQQQNPELLNAIKTFYNSFFSPAKTAEAIQQLYSMGSIHEYEGQALRYYAIAKGYLESPGNTLILSPDHESRNGINLAVRKMLREDGLLGTREFTAALRVNRQELFQEDTRVARNYRIGDEVRASRGDKALGVKGGDYVRVAAVDRENNLLTVIAPDQKRLTYNPRIHDLRAAVYRTEYRGFSVGDRIQFTVPWREKGVANRQLGTIESLDEHGNARIRLDCKAGDDAGRMLRFHLDSFSHIDYGYTMTSMASQGTTAWRVLAHVDPADRRVREMIDKVLAYVMFSRAAGELHIYTSNREELVPALAEVEFAPTALSEEQIREYRVPLRGPTVEQHGPRVA